MQLTQVQLVQIVSSAVSQALTQQMQQRGNNPPSATVANHVPQSNTIVQQVQSPIKVVVSALEGDSAANWLTWGQRVVYQAKACGFETDLTADEGNILSVGADVFDKSNVDPVRLQNAQGAWMALITAAEKLQLKSCKAPNDAQIDVQELEVKQLPQSQEVVRETLEALSEHEEVVQKVLSEHNQDGAGPAAEATNLVG